MKRKKAIFALVMMVVLIFAAVIGCNKGEEKKGEQVTTLKIGVLPVEDTIPLIIGQEKGYFTEERVKVELVPFQSAMEKDSALQSGQLDGVITDLIVAALLKDSGSDIKITTLTSGVTPREGRFAILTAPGGDIQDLSGLKGKKIGISSNTIIEYVTDGLLREAGIDPSEVEKVLVPKLSLRLELLLNGKIDAVTLPDPLAAFAEFSGAKAFGDDSAKANLSQVVLVMNDKSIEEKEGALKGFFAAYNKALKEYNADPEKYRSLVVEQARVPEPIKSTYKLPVFPSAQLPKEKEVNDVLNWLKNKGVIKNDTTYEKLIKKGLY